jgi:hypothetical protein
MLHEISVCEIYCRQGVADAMLASSPGGRVIPMPRDEQAEAGTLDLDAWMFEGELRFLHRMQFLRVEATSEFSYRRRNFRGNSICLS